MSAPATADAGRGPETAPAGLPRTTQVLALLNQRTAGIVAGPVELALTRRSRRRGLLGRPGLDPPAALLLAPCRAVHTAFMRFEIDVLFLDVDWRVRHIARALPPWRVATCFDARLVIELSAGTIGSRICVGDRLHLVSISRAGDGADRTERRPGAMAASG